MSNQPSLQTAVKNLERTVNLLGRIKFVLGADSLVIKLANKQYAPSDLAAELEEIKDGAQEVVNICNNYFATLDSLFKPAEPTIEASMTQEQITAAYAALDSVGQYEATDECQPCMDGTCAVHEPDESIVGAQPVELELVTSNEDFI